MLYSLLAECVSRFPDRVAVSDPAGTLTYHEFLEAVDVVDRCLEEAGLQPGDAAAVQFPNSLECAVALLALMKRGVAALPLDPGLRPPEVEKYCALAGAGTLLCRPGASQQVAAGAPVRRPLPPLEALLRGTCGPARSAGTGGMQRSGDQIAFLLLSAGTTGPPKIVPRTAAQIEAALSIFRATLPYSEEDRVLAVLPFFHSFGLLNVLLSTIAAGATLCVAAFSPRDTAAAIEREQITVLPATPFMFRLLTEADFRTLPHFARLRLAVSVGSALSPAVALGFQEKFGVAVAQSYGTTETGPVALARPEERLDGAGWVGRPYAGVTVEIQGADGRALGPGAQGLVAVKSAANAVSYLGDVRASANVFKGGRVFTGDVGRIDEAGHLFVLGRARPMLNVAGKKVSPAEVEACLRTHSRVADVLVVGAEAARADQKVKAFVVPAGAVTAPELMDFCRQRLADFKVPRQIVFVEDLSRGPMGKPSAVAPEPVEE